MPSALAGLTMILLAAFFFSCRSHFTKGRLWIATGAVYAIGGILNLIIFSAIIGRALLTVQGVIIYPIGDALNVIQVLESIGTGLFVPASMAGAACFLTSTTLKGKGEIENTK